jgi:lysophospholipase L1-like esterase
MWSLRLLAAGLLLSLVGATAIAQEKKNTAVVPNQRKDKGATDRHAKFVARAKQGNVDVLFLGDSITQGWEGGAAKDVWQKNFGSLNPANFGIGGDKTQDVLWRLTEGKELDGISPKVCVLMIGTNNTGANSAEEISAGVEAVVKELQKQRPEMKILLLGVFPRSGKGAKQLMDATKVQKGEFNTKIPDINKTISKLDDGKKVKYLDIGGKFLDADGALTKTIMPDFLHLSGQGYALWADAIKSTLEGMLKS